MLGKKRIDALIDVYKNARAAFLSAVKADLMEVGRDMSVVNDEDNGREGVFVETIFSGVPCFYEIDMVRYDRDADEILAHCTEIDGKKVDEWIYLSYIGDAMDYVLDGIDWESVVTD